MKKSASRIACWAGGILILLLGCSSARKDWSPVESPLKTRWARKVDPKNVWKEYPRPIMERRQWKNLNGIWELAIVSKDSAQPSFFPDRILVPFPVESALSGIGRRLTGQDRIWYRRMFGIPGSWKKGRVLLHFGAVDWDARVIINGNEAGGHLGGYDPFTLDITDWLVDGEQELVVSVWDPSDEGGQPIGKQHLFPRGIFYTPSSGIWQTVWLEPVPVQHIQSLILDPDLEASVLRVRTVVNETFEGKFRASVSAGDRTISTFEGRPCEIGVISVPDAHLWTPEDPFLYDLELVLMDVNGEILDRVESYFAMRRISIGKDESGKNRILLNGNFVFQLGPLDQGFWPDGLYTPPSDEAMKHDIEIMKSLGFNAVRKHVKVEPQRWYTWCDRLGLLVWQDMPSGANRTPEERVQFEEELRNLVLDFGNHPSIVAWVPFNEGWGQYDTPRIVQMIREWDPSRIVNGASGWHDTGAGDVNDIHSYPDPQAPLPETTRALVLGEFGGLGCNVPDHLWNQSGWGYDLLGDRDALASRYENLYEQLMPLIQEPGLSAAIYTQLTDIETENNGLLTYDREVVKIPVETARNAHAGYLAPQPRSRARVFIDSTRIELQTVRKDGVIRYTLDGTEVQSNSPILEGPVLLTETTIIKARAFWDQIVSRPMTVRFDCVKARPGEEWECKYGAVLDYYEGDWDTLPNLACLLPVHSRVVNSIGLETIRRMERFAVRFRGGLKIPQTGVYVFSLSSDDGSQFIIGDSLLVDNDGLHGMREKWGNMALEQGCHPFTLLYFQKGGGLGLEFYVEGPGMDRQRIPDRWLVNIER